MNEEQMKKRGNSLITPKKIMRILSIFCVIFVFCPSFLVSCSGQKMNVTVMTAVGGMSMYGEKVVDPHPIMLICLLLPIAMLVLLFMKKFSDRKTAIIVASCAAVDTVVWLIFRATVKKLVEENYCSFKTTAWYVLNIIALLLILTLSILVILKKIQIDIDLIAKVSNSDMQGKLDQVTNAVNVMSNQVSEMASNVVANVSSKKNKSDIMGYCSKCGSGIEYGLKFCTSCGTPVPQEMIAEAEEKKRIAEEQAAKEAEEKLIAEEKAAAEKESKSVNSEDESLSNVTNTETVNRFCQQCGAKLEINSVFCENCGTKVE